MLSINAIVPEFEVDAYHQNEVKKVKLSDYKGKWVVLLFYPGDFTFVCPTELEEASEQYEEFKKLGAEVLSVSTDSVWVHKAWHDESPAINKVEFPMLADPTGKLCQTLGCYIDAEGVSLRGTYIIDPDGRLKTVQLHDNSIGRSVKELLRTLAAAKFVREHAGLVCPASWEPGKETLKPGLDLVGRI